MDVYIDNLKIGSIKITKETTIFKVKQEIQKLLPVNITKYIIRLGNGNTELSPTVFSINLYDNVNFSANENILKGGFVQAISGYKIFHNGTEYVISWDGREMKANNIIHKFIIPVSKEELDEDARYEYDIDQNTNEQIKLLNAYFNYKLLEVFDEETNESIINLVQNFIVDTILGNDTSYMPKYIAILTDNNISSQSGKKYLLENNLNIKKMKW